MQLSATLPLAIGLKCFWFLIALFLYPKSTILGLSFLDPKDLCLPNQFLRGSWQKRSDSTYLTWLMPKKKLDSFNDLINTYFQSFICLPQYEHFLASISAFPWHCWTEVSQSSKELRKILRSHENLQSLTDLSGTSIGMFMMSKINLLMNKNMLLLDRSRLYKSLKSGNGTKISYDKWRLVKPKYLENKKWSNGYCKKH